MPPRRSLTPVPAVLSGAALCALACAGRIEEPSPAGRDEAPGGPGPILPAGAADRPPGEGLRTSGGPGLPTKSCPAVTPRRLRRLSLAEYERAVRALVGQRVPLLVGLLPDPQVHGFDNNADALVISTGRFEEIALAAEQVAASVDIAGLAGCDAAADGGGEACAERFVNDLPRRAFGRPLTAAERARLLGVYRAGAEAEGRDAGLRLVLETVLQSPHFLYRSEVGAPDEPGAPGRAAPAESTLAAHEIARQLAFALTGGPPDAELDRAADRGAVATRDGLRAEARRLLEAPAARLHFGRFLRSWLGVQDVRKVAKIQGFAISAFTEEIKRDADLGVGLDLDHALGPGGGTWAALLEPAMSFVSKRTEGLYAGTLVDTPPAEGFQRVRLRPELRQGVVSLPAWLARHSPPHRSSPVERGLVVRNRFFCLSLPPPPGDVQLATVDARGPTQTTRDKFEEHSRNATCWACHRLIDPVGFGLENMDALGRFRTEDNGGKVNAQGLLEGTDVDGPFMGPAELAGKLLRSRSARDCFVVELYRFLEGREETAEDACELRPLQEFFAARDRKIADLIVEIVARDNFGDRKVEP
jgi:hypothetical protein